MESERSGVSAPRRFHERLLADLLHDVDGRIRAEIKDKIDMTKRLTNYG
jgi:hypothetical protein